MTHLVSYTLTGQPPSLAEYVADTGLPLTGDALTYASQCWAEASELVARHCEGATVPADIIARAKLEVGAELYHRRKAPNGISQFADSSGVNLRIARDPMVAAYPLLRPFVGLGIA